MLSPRVAPALTGNRIRRRPVWPFPGRDPMLPMTTRQFNGAVHTAAGMAGIKPPTPHTLRTVLPPPARAEYRCSQRRDVVFIFSTKAWTASALCHSRVRYPRMLHQRPRNLRASPRRPLVGDDLCGLFSHEPAKVTAMVPPPELFVEPMERRHLRHVPLSWRHPYRSEACRTQRGHGA